MSIEEAQALRTARVTQLRATLDALPLEQHPVTLEIGCGHGHFLTAYAAAHPDEFCVAVDLLADRLARAKRKSDRAGLSNIAWLQAEAEDLLEAWPESARIGRCVFVLFPDPWPKRRHWKNRLIQPGFLTRLAQRCRPGTRLCFRTDHAPYFFAATQCLRDHPDWEYGDGIRWPFEESTVFQTRASGFQSAVARRRQMRAD